MPHKVHYALHDAELQYEIVRARKIIAVCIQVLQQSHPDTFLGRQRHEPIPISYDQDEATLS
jgi:hypothetical protein